ncbi:MAG: ATP-binding protein [Bacteroidota bacterium]|nr:ATP-binding protein [Bacteroidota bacterium]MDP3146477.1 ATP-binding protein [Bacteroidota bacterium]
MDKSYSDIIFGKDLHQLTYDDIADYFIDEQEENSVLEFKSGDVGLESIYKEACAFLNTQGGLIIIGAPIEKTKGDKTICKGPLTNSNFKSKDWLSQKVISNIQPSPGGINIIEREKNGIKIFVCEIGQSVNPPHQCSSDGKYYIRLEAEAKFAPHGIVLALFNKRKVAELDIDLKVEINSNMREITTININIKNKTEIPTDTVHYLVEIYNADKTGLLKFDYVPNAEYKKLNLSGKIDMPLIQGIAAPLRFWFESKSEKALVSIIAWSKEIPMTVKYCIINTFTKDIEFKGDNYSEKTLIDAIAEVKILT